MSIALPPAAGRGAAHSGAGAPATRLARTALALVAVTTASALALGAPPALAADACPNAALRTAQQASNAPDCRAYELVSPADKAGQSIDTLKTVQSSPDGNAVAFSAAGAFGDAPTSVSGGYYVARRSASAWSSHGIDLPQGNRDGQVATPSIYLADDLSKAFQFSGRALLPGAIEDGGNLYLTDTQSGTRELVAATSNKSLKDTLVRFGIRFTTGASSDLSHMVFRSPASLLPGVPPGTTNVYEYANGQLRLVSILEDGTVDTGASIGSEARSQRVVSADGSKVFFTSTNNGVLYARVNGTTTVPISVSRRAGDPSTPAAANFAGASKDGNVVYFYTATPLTDDASSGISMYRYDFRTDSLTNESLSTTSPQRADVLVSKEVSEDGEYVYFVAAGALTPGTTVLGGDDANFYVSHNGEVKFVAVLGSNGPGALTTSKNGRYLAFVSERRLTSEDNTDPACAGACNEVYFYDAVTGALTCPSCSPVDGRSRAADLGPAAEASISDYKPTVVTDDGRLFFGSEARLVKEDTNGLRDVYEWNGQRVSLVSSGRGSDESRLADVSADGRDVSFLTAQRLVAQDTDHAIDLYDARVGGGLAAQNVLPAAAGSVCDGDACQGRPGGVPVPAFAGSVTFTGPAAVPDGSQEAKGTGKPTVSQVGTVRGTSTRIRVKVAGKGKIQASGSGLRPAARTASKAGTYEVTVALSERARRTLSRRHRVRVRVTVRFTPSGGKAQSVQVPVTFEPKAKKQQKSSSRSVRRVIALSSDARKGR